MNEEVLIQAYNEQSKEVQQLTSELESYKLALQIRKIKGEQKEANKGGNKRFTMVFHTYGKKVDQQLSERSLALLMILVHRLQFDTNIIVDKEGERMSLQDISEVIGWTKKKTAPILEELIDKGILHKCRKGIYTYYIMSNEYAICGNVDKILQVIEQNLQVGNG